MPERAENPDQPSARPARGASPLGKALAAQSEAQFSDLARARGLAGETFAALAERAARLLDRCADATNRDALDALRATRATLSAVARLLDNPKADEIPPTNNAIYAATLDITELEPIVAGLRPAVSTDRILAHLTPDDPAAGRRDRLALATAAVCARAGLHPRVPSEPGSPVTLEHNRWTFAAAPTVPLDAAELPASIAAAERALRDAGKPGLIILEAGALLEADPLRVADDTTALSVMNERLDSFMLGVRDGVIGALDGTDSHKQPNAFGLVVHATMPATNVASRRLLFAECVRAVNLCDTSDSRIHGFQAFADALARAGRPQRT